MKRFASISLAAAVLACAFVAGADDAKAPPDPKEQFAKKYAAYKTKCAEEIFKIAEFLAGKKQYASAKPEYEAAVVRDPDFAKARQKLGFKKQGNAWVKDPAFKSPGATDDPKGDPDGKVIDKYKTDRKSCEKKLADEAFGVGKWAAGVKLQEEAVKMYREAVDWFSNHEEAHKALGHRKEGVKWISADEDKERAGRDQKAKDADGGKEYGEGTDAEKALGAKYSKRKSAHFDVQAYFSQDKVVLMVKAGELTFHEFHELFELDEKNPDVGMIEVLFLENKKAHEEYLAHLAGYAGKDLEYHKKFGRDTQNSIPRIESNHGDEKDPTFPQDFVIHDTFHVLFNRHYQMYGDALKGWLYECPAYWISGKLNGSAICVCVGNESVAAGAQRLGSDPHYWQMTVKDMVINHKDPEMRTTLICSLNSLTGEMIAKGWSVWDFLVKEHKKKLFGFLDALKGGKDQDEALQEAFGWKYDELDHFWSEWVRKNY